MAGASDSKPRFEELLEFPADYTFRVVGEDGPHYSRTVTDCVERVVGRACRVVSQQPSKTGKWLVVRVATTVHSADEIRAVYGALDGVPSVRMVL